MSASGKSYFRTVQALCSCCDVGAGDEALGCSSGNVCVQMDNFPQASCLLFLSFAHSFEVPGASVQALTCRKF